jgi:ABC-2 type transport system ATP-binding protein
VFGLDSRRQGDAVRERSGALLEHHGLYERLSAWQNLDFHARAWRMPASRRSARIRELLSQFGLWERKDDIVGTWSRGMKQKLAVARAVLHRPPLVFLDEPTAGLDPVASASLREDLAKLTQQEGVTIFLTTHNLSEAERLCGLVGVIRKGRLVAFGTPTSLRGAHGPPLVQVTGRGLSDAVVDSLGVDAGVEVVGRREDGVTIRLAPDASAAPVVAWLVSRGVEIEEVRRDRASFEDAFLDLVTQDGGGSA